MKGKQGNLLTSKGFVLREHTASRTHTPALNMPLVGMTKGFRGKDAFGFCSDYRLAGKENWWKNDHMM